MSTYISMDWHAVLHGFSLLTSPIMIGFWITGVLVLLPTKWRLAKVLWILSAIGSVGYALYRGYHAVVETMDGKTSLRISVPILNHRVSLTVINITGLDIVTALIGLALLTMIAHLALLQSGYSWGDAARQVWNSMIPRGLGRTKRKVYRYPPVVIGTGIGEAEPGLPGDRTKAGRKIVIQPEDRFLNVGIVGPIGSGKTFRTMKVQALQDLEAMGQGQVLANMLWISPQPEPDIERRAEQLGIRVRRIHIGDGQVNGKGTNIRYNPLSGKNLDQIIANVDILLNEQTADKGRGDPFFDTMVRQATINTLWQYKLLYGFDIEGNLREVYITGWYDTYLVNMDEVFHDAKRVQAVVDAEENGRVDPLLNRDKRARFIREVIWPRLTKSERIGLKRAAASIINEFGGEVSGKTADSYKNIIRGLRGKVSVLVSSPAVQELIGEPTGVTAGRPNFDFAKWIDPRDWVRKSWESLKHYLKNALLQHKPELLMVTTGNTAAGRLIARMIMLFDQSAVVNRPGNDSDKPGVFTYVDEFPVYATKSISELFTQGRKHCHSMVVSMQSRTQLDTVAPGYLEIVEASCRHWIYLSNLGFQDAEAVSQMAGKVRKTEVRTTTSQTTDVGLGGDTGFARESVSHLEQWVDRFSYSYIRYGLGKTEAIYIGVLRGKGQVPLRLELPVPQENKHLTRKIERAHRPRLVFIPSNERRDTVMYPDTEATTETTASGMHEDQGVAKVLEQVETSTWEDIIPLNEQVRVETSGLEESGDDEDVALREVGASQESDPSHNPLEHLKSVLRRGRGTSSPRCPMCGGEMVRQVNAQGSSWTCTTESCSGPRN